MAAAKYCELYSKACPILDLQAGFPGSVVAGSEVSLNPDLQTLVDAVQKTADVPFQVRISEDLATKVKVFWAQNKLSHKQLVTNALVAYMDEKNESMISYNLM